MIEGSTSLKSEVWRSRCVLGNVRLSRPIVRAIANALERAMVASSANAGRCGTETSPQSRSCLSVSFFAVRGSICGYVR